MIDYDRTAMPEAYDAGRSYTPHALKHWLATISGSIQNRGLARILDLGCGTGRYSSALAEHFGADVYAIDPSERMLEQARRKRHPRVRYERAPGEQLPLSDGSVDLVFMSMVFHHFDDPVTVAHECHRVLRSGGSVCLRAGTREQISTYPYVPFFRRSASILDRLLQSRDFIEDTFLEADLPGLHHELVASETAVNWEHYAEKLAYRADSVLSQLTDEEFQTGLEEELRSDLVYELN